MPTVRHRSDSPQLPFPTGVELLDQARRAIADARETLAQVLEAHAETAGR